MITKTATTTHLAQMLTHARAGTDALFGLVRPEAFYERPVPERHRIVFYFGHLEAFDWNLISQPAAVPSFSPEFDQLFAFGIDPKPGQAQQDERSDWPEIAEIREYNRRVRQTLDDVLDRISEELLYTALEHRLMHAETFAYLLHSLSIDQKHLPLVAPVPESAAPIHVMREIPGGTVTLGQRRKDASGKNEFGWDNEFEGHEVAVASFAMSKYKVTNGEYLEFVRAGAKPPHFWKWHGGQWYWRGMWEDVPLPLDWPVYATYEEASAFAAWSGKRLPTEAEFHRAAYGTVRGEEEPAYPWGNEPPDSRRGNFGGSRWDPISVTASPLGDSAFGISQLVGNGWEWTSTVFQPFVGFQPFSFYPGYSARFFDGAHYVLKGASPRTDARLLRRSFRNWFRPNFPYVYAGFRCVEV
ncbi:MAG TPA: SUMF1/EgtB/PvdO family nonheme iron enzyme [Nitrospira sp.]|nr:SUMF1/EgtB/PvdO family nonheme iron enzyme [Nitrospira sp.]